MHIFPKNFLTEPHTYLYHDFLIFFFESGHIFQNMWLFGKVHFVIQFWIRLAQKCICLTKVRAALNKTKLNDMKFQINLNRRGIGNWMLFIIRLLFEICFWWLQMVIRQLNVIVFDWCWVQYWECNIKNITLTLARPNLST